MARLGAVAILIVLLSISPLVGARQVSERLVSLDVPQQPLGEALNDLAAQCGLRLVFYTDTAEGRFAQRLRGKYTPEGALKVLLANSDLTYQFIDANTVHIRDAGVDAVPRPLKINSDLPSSSPAAPTVVTQSAQPPTAAASATGGAAPSEPIEQVVVTGTHIVGTAPVGSSLTTYTRKQIEATGAASIDQFARKMPQNFSSVDALGSVAANPGGLNQTGDNSSLGAGFNLHGIGPGATLTLVNGHRIAPSGLKGVFADVSMIPLAAVDRIEVLSDGASAIYGADAIAGVVNILLRTDFEGAQTSMRYSTTDDGGATQRTASQLFGHSWNSGNMMLVYEFSDQDALHSAERDFLPAQLGSHMVSPEQKRHSAFLVGRQEIGNTVLKGDLLYSAREFRADHTTTGFLNRADGKPDLFGGTLSLDRSLPAGWHGTLSANYSQTEQPSVGTVPAFQQATTVDVRTRLASFNVLASGPVLSLPAGVASAAIGAEYRSDRYERSDVISAADQEISNAARSRSRKVSSIFGEITIPLLGDSRDVRAPGRLQLSLAGRFDDYDDVGSTTNPKIGLAWIPIRGLQLRASCGEAYHPPLVADLIEAHSFVAFRLPNPASPTGLTNTLSLEGSGNANLRPETARSYSFGFEFTPPAYPNLQLTGSYFNVDYKDRIARPPIVGSLFSIWNQTDTLWPFFDLSPDPAEIEAIFATGLVLDITGAGPAGIQAVFNNRIQNIALTEESGAALAINWTIPLAKSSLSLSLSGEHRFKNEYRAVYTALPVDLLNRLGAPVDQRLRGSIAWTRGGFGAVLSFDHLGSYVNPLFNPEERIGSWLTTDLQLTYRTGDLSASALLNQLDLALIIQNLANKEPPHVNVPANVPDLGFDGANATPFGRTVVLNATKSW